MRFIHFYVENYGEYVAFDDDATDEEIQTDFVNWLDGSTSYGWYEVDSEDIPPYILNELSEDDN